MARPTRRVSGVARQLGEAQADIDPRLQELRARGAQIEQRVVLIHKTPQCLALDSAYRFTIHRILPSIFASFRLAQYGQIHASIDVRGSGGPNSIQIGPPQSGQLAGMERGSDTVGRILPEQILFVSKESYHEVLLIVQEPCRPGFSCSDCRNSRQVRSFR